MTESSTTATKFFSPGARTWVVAPATQAPVRLINSNRVEGFKILSSQLDRPRLSPLALAICMPLVLAIRSIVFVPCASGNWGHPELKAGMADAGVT